MYVSSRDIESEDDENEAKADAEGGVVNRYVLCKNTVEEDSYM